MMDRTIYTLELPPLQRDRVAELARLEGTTVSEIVRAGMQRYCAVVVGQAEVPVSFVAKALASMAEPREDALPIVP